MAPVGAIIMKYMLEELTASQLRGPMLSICISKCIYMDDNVWQIEEKIETSTHSPLQSIDSK